MILMLLSLILVPRPYDKQRQQASSPAARLRSHQQEAVAFWTKLCILYADSLGGQANVKLSFKAVYDFQKLHCVLDTFLSTYYDNDFLTKEEFFVAMRRRDIESYYTDRSFFRVLHPQLDYLYTYASDVTFNVDILKYMIFVYHYLTYIMFL